MTEDFRELSAAPPRGIKPRLERLHRIFTAELGQPVEGEDTLAGYGYQFALSTIVVCRGVGVCEPFLRFFSPKICLPAFSISRCGR